MPHILLTTFGLSWPIIPELVGLTNPRCLDLYAQHPERERIDNLRETALSPVDELWIVGTGGGDTKKEIERILEWQRRLPEIDKPLLRIWLTADAEDLLTAADSRVMAETIFRVTCLARERSSGGRLLLSLTGGRKTMSTDLQRAAGFFGCDALLHILDRGNAKGLKDLGIAPFLAPLEKPYHDCFMPLMAGQSRRNSLLDIDRPIAVADYPVALPADNECLCVHLPESDGLVDELERREREAVQLSVNYITDLVQSEAKSGFLALYRLPAEQIRGLKETRIGASTLTRDHDLALLRRLPKAELHCHLGGIADTEEILRMASTCNEALSPYRQELEGWLGAYRPLIRPEGIAALRQQCLPKDHRSKPGVPEPLPTAALVLLFAERPELLTEFVYGEYRDEIRFCSIGFDAYERFGDLQGSGLLQCAETIREACRILLEKARAHNVRYLELRCSPENYTRGGLTAEQVLAILEEELGGQAKPEVRLIIIGSRHGKMSQVYRHVELVEGVLERSEHLICGFDLAGDEQAKRASEVRFALRTLMERCLHFTIHAGENVPARSIWEAVYDLNAERIGHGLTLKENKDLLQHFNDRKIALEMCPSSNFQIVGFRDFLLPGTEHLTLYPLKGYLDQGLTVTVNTDNPGISRTDLTQELYKAACMTEGGLSVWEILVLIKNSFKSSFGDGPTRWRLLKEAEKEIMDMISQGRLV